MVAPRQRNKRPGTAAVEFAAILSVLVLIVLGCVDFGRFAYSYIAVSNAARAGAGYGSVHPFTPFTEELWRSRIREAVAQEMQLIPGFDPDGVQITTGTEGEEPWTERWVTVEVPYSFHTIMNWPALPVEVPMRRTVTMRLIR